MNEILKIFPYSSRTISVKFKNEDIARRANPGNFVVIRFSEKAARLPFAIVDTDPSESTVEIIIHGYEGLGEMRKYLAVGSELHDVLGPLGKTPNIDRQERVLCCGDGAGFIPLLPVIKALDENGCKVFSVMSETTDTINYISDEVENHSDLVILANESSIYTTIEEVISTHGITKIWMSGPTGLLKNLTEIANRLDIPADCILNMIMIDGIGLCGTCRVIVGGERKQTCIDGPVFDARKVDFDQLLNRQRLFE